MAISDLAAVVKERMAFWQVLAEEQARQARAEVPAEPCLVGARRDDVGRDLDLPGVTQDRVQIAVEFREKFARVIRQRFQFLEQRPNDAAQLADVHAADPLAAPHDELAHLPLPRCSSSGTWR